jgi:hypothetical protein
MRNQQEKEDMKKLIVVLSVAAVVALALAGVFGVLGGNQTATVYASRLAGIKAAGATGIQVQNLDPAMAATVVADFYKQGGGAAVPINLPPIEALSAFNIYLPSESKLTNGAYAAIISGDRQLAAIARTEWASSGGAALYSNVAPSTIVALPLATKKYVGQNSLVSIQNTDPDQQASVTVKLFQSGNSSAVMTKQYTIEKGTSITLDMGLNPDFDTLPTPFLGSLTVESATPVGVQSFVDIEPSEKAVYAFEGVPAEQAAAKLYAPLFRNDFYGTTGISVVNPGTDPVQVTVNFAGSLPAGGACDGQNYSQGPATIAPGSSAVFYQANVDIPGTGMSPLPTNCAGSATITSEGGDVLAIVNDASGNPAAPTTSAAYNAVSDAQGAMKVALPLYRNKHTKDQITTGIQAMNIGDGTARAVIKFTMSDGTQVAGCGECTRTIAPGASTNWYPPTIQGLAENKYGSAFIDSDQPLAVIVNDASLTATFDAAIYNGIKADVQ